MTVRILPRPTYDKPKFVPTSQAKDVVVNVAINIVKDKGKSNG